MREGNARWSKVPGETLLGGELRASLGFVYPIGGRGEFQQLVQRPSGPGYELATAVWARTAEHAFRARTAEGTFK